MSDSFDLQRLRGQIKPFRLYWYPTLRSTNDHAAKLRKQGELFAPAIVLTGRQTAGRGRGGNAWWSGVSGVLTVTFVFPVEEHLAPHQLPLIAGLAVRNAVAQAVDQQDIALKWPNDVVVGTRKLAGLLCERVHRADLIGLGLNVSLTPGQVPKHLRDKVTSLSQISGGRTIDKTDVLIAVARQLHQTLGRRDETTFSDILRQYDSYHALLGKQVTVLTSQNEPPITGRCEGLDTMGRLILRGRNGAVHRIIAGHVVVR